jgi:hypothetical protein
VRSSLREKEMKKDMRRELAELTPSVFEPFYPDFKVLKTSKPKYSEKNNSAFLLVTFLNNSFCFGTKTRAVFRFAQKTPYKNLLGRACC